MILASLFSLSVAAALIPATAAAGFRETRDDEPGAAGSAGKDL